MTAPTFYPGALQWVGLAPETVYGTAVAAPTIWVPCKTPKWSAATTPLIDDGLRGMMGTDYGYAQGMRHDTLTYDMNLYPVILFQHMLAILGHPDTVTGTGPYTHATALLNSSGGSNAQPPSFTGFLASGDKTLQIPGMRAVEMKLDIKADALPTVTVSWDGLPATFIATPANTPPAGNPIPPWTASMSLGGTSMAFGSEIQLDYKRDTKPVPILNGTQAPLQISAGPLTVTGTVTGVWQGSTDPFLTDLINDGGTQAALQVVAYLAGSPADTVSLTSTVVAFTKADPSGGSSGWMELASDFTALMNPTDALDSQLSQAQVQMVNSTSTAIL